MCSHAVVIRCPYKYIITYFSNSVSHWKTALWLQAAIHCFSEKHSFTQLPTCQLRAYRFSHSGTWKSGRTGGAVKLLRARETCKNKNIVTNYAGAAEFPSIVQLNSVRTTPLSRKDANNIQEICSNVRSLACAESALTRGFQVSQNRRILRCSTRFPWCGVGTTWGLHLWITDEGHSREFSERALLPKVRSLITRTTTDAR